MASYRRLLRREAVAGYLFAAPWLAGLLLFILGPIVAALTLSFTDYEIVKPPTWSGADNYRRLLADDPLFWKSLGNTLYYAGFTVPLNMVLGLGIALLLNRDLPGMRLLRTMYYLPSVVAGVAVSVLWSWMLNPDFGLVNTLLGYIGIRGPAWIASVTWSKASFIIMSLWGAGGSMIIYLAGLQGVPRHLYEVAEIDGAGRFARFRVVTLPMLTPTILFSLIVNTIGSFQVFTQAYVITNGGPANSTLFYVLYLFRNAFEFFKMGYASAMAWVLFCLILALTLAQLRLGRRFVYYEGEVR